MYKFIKSLRNSNKTSSLAINLYQDLRTNKYYVSDTCVNSEDIIDDSNKFMLLDNKPKIYRPPYLKHIDNMVEVEQKNFQSGYIDFRGGSYLLNTEANFIALGLNPYQFHQIKPYQIHR